MGKLLIVTGMSGAGKTIALKSLEDMGYYCVDNLPIPLIDKFAELIIDGHEQIAKAALGIDVRSGNDLPLLKEVLDTWDIKGASTMRSCSSMHRMRVSSSASRKPGVRIRSVRMGVSKPASRRSGRRWAGSRRRPITSSTLRTC